MNPLLARALEPLLLRRRERRVSEIADADRAVLGRELITVLQKSEAAEILAGHGHTVEALRLQAEALRVAYALVFGESKGDEARGVVVPGWLGLSEERVAAIRAALQDAGRAYPARNDDVRAEHTAAFERMARATLDLQGAVRPVVAGRAGVVRDRVLRIGALVLLLVLVVSYGVSQLGRVEVRASGHFRSLAACSPDKILDGDPGTEWLLENGQTGWIEVTFRPRQIAKVRLLNSKNLASDPRATGDFRVELYAGAALKAAHDGSFGPYRPKPEWVEVPLAADGVDRLRIIVKSVHNTGGGLADVSWE